MNRPIKFRAWDTKYCEMELKNPRAYDLWSTYPKRIELMQFTGLHDKNGKDIYEGDVFPSDKGNWVVKFGAWDFWTGKNLTPMYGWYGECLTLEGKSHHQLPLTPTSTGEHVEIIGNIYEKPELV